MKPVTRTWRITTYPISQQQKKNHRWLNWTRRVLFYFWFFFFWVFLNFISEVAGNDDPTPSTTFVSFAAAAMAAACFPAFFFVFFSFHLLDSVTWFLHRFFVFRACGTPAEVSLQVSVSSPASSDPIQLTLGETKYKFPRKKIIIINWHSRRVREPVPKRKKNRRALNHKVIR